VTVTITNLCPKGSEGGWCDAPRRHLDMSEYAWLQIRNRQKGGARLDFDEESTLPKARGS